MLQSGNPNQTLAEKIIAELLSNELILDVNVPQIQQLLMDGKMSEKFWIAAFDKKIKALDPTE
ncbi:hypothetical protein AQ505_16705 [Pedobacter sp. PACM 27299]|uniref:hypothetical protein n=1 Tax=Pedobacter sp. PACM 27299 TaxID=1727164 RepID=UPI00070681C9|nr:hypothetical protein [Pedobacter sp. PACM 27299]ALL06981.1 hypothetical protein AQ505_16705 [Pedobacter sp. PACM 27299]